MGIMPIGIPGIIAMGIIPIDIPGIIPIGAFICIGIAGIIAIRPPRTGTSPAARPW
jgi:hypothetical protein